MATQNEVLKKQYFTKQDCIKKADDFIDTRYDKSKLDPRSYEAIRREFINHYLGMTLEDYEIKSSQSCTPVETGLNYFFVENVRNITVEELIKKINDCELVVAVAADKIGEKSDFEILSGIKQRISDKVSNGELELRETYSFRDCETNQYTLSIQKVLKPTD